MATTAFGRSARAVDPASLLLGPRPSAAVPVLLRLVVGPEKKLGLSCGLPHVNLELPHVSCDPVGAAGFNLPERAQARGTHAGRRGSRDPLYSFNNLLEKIASGLPGQKSRSWTRNVRPGCGSPH